MIRIGCGSAFDRDRIDWGERMACSGLVNDMGFDCLAERSMALNQIRKEVTAEAVRAKFGSLVSGDVTRYEYPNLPGLNFVITGTLQGGVSTSLRVDGHGKAYASLLLDLDI
jgi:hypothetical protein